MRTMMLWRRTLLGLPALAACGDSGVRTSDTETATATTNPGTNATTTATGTAGSETEVSSSSDGQTEASTSSESTETDPVETTGETEDPCAVPCGEGCCDDGELCTGDVLCKPDLGPCATDNDCQNDSYCDDELLHCIPYDPGATGDMCSAAQQPGIFRVSVQCEWSGPPDDDPYPSSADVSVKPLVADFRIGAQPDDPAAPSIVIVSNEPSVIRVLDGETCEQRFTLDDYTPTSASTPALGDINGDGKPEIIAHLIDGGAAAWTYDEVMQDFVVLWRTTDKSAVQVQSVSLADIDDDGTPEVILGGVIYNADGTLKSAAAGPGDKLCSGGYTAPSVIADVDVDDQLELVHGGSIWTWNAIADDMVLEPYWMGNFTGAFTAVADFGDFPGLMGDGPGRAEVVAMSPGSVRVHTIGGDLLFGPAALPGGGDGGNITIADFDGDGAPEFGVVGSTRYVVYDPACGDPMFEGECGTMTDNGILWQAVIDENSCAIMGSTVFDFEGDGAAEVVYADECYIRVYEGKTGGVVWSHPRSSATWYDAPIVVDSDGDGRAELISPFSPYGNGGCPAIDPSFEGLRCTEQFACPGDALTCDEGLCRCVEDVDCGDPDMVCTAALPQSPGVGNVCRPKFSVRTGLRVYSDVNWVGSRTIWNQHAYSVTNVNTDGTIPKGSEVERNWQVEGLNNFRQNVQDELGIVSGPDLTVEAIGFNQDCSADNPLLSIQAEVCNRGEVVVDPPIEVNFYDGDPEMGGALLCTAETTIPLVPGDCEIVACLYPNPPLDEPIEIHVRVDEKGVVTECLEGNNSGSLIAQCPPPPPE